MDARDNQKKMLYYLEDHSLHKGAKFSSTEFMQDYVNFITATEFWRDSVQGFGVPGMIRVFSNGDNNTSFADEPNEIWMAICHWNQQVVLHELAHFFAEDHPPKYIRAYLDLVANFMGLEVAKQYRQAFKLGKIKF